MPPAPRGLLGAPVDLSYPPRFSGSETPRSEGLSNLSHLATTLPDMGSSIYSLDSQSGPFEPRSVDAGNLSRRPTRPVAASEPYQYNYDDARRNAYQPPPMYRQPPPPPSPYELPYSSSVPSQSRRGGSSSRTSGYPAIGGADPSSSKSKKPSSYRNMSPRERAVSPREQQERDEEALERRGSKYSHAAGKRKWYQDTERDEPEGAGRRHGKAAEERPRRH